jgi:hypothetical protein
MSSGNCGHRSGKERLAILSDICNLWSTLRQTGSFDGCGKTGGPPFVLASSWLATMVDVLGATSADSSVNCIAAFQISYINRFFKRNSRRLCPTHPSAGVLNHYPVGRNVLQGIHTKAVNSGKAVRKR